MVYRSEKKKILRSNIDLCQHVLRILKWVEEGINVNIDTFKEQYMAETDMEK